MREAIDRLPHGADSLLFLPELSAASLWALVHGDVAGIWHPRYMDVRILPIVLENIHAAFAAREAEMEDQPKSLGRTLGYGLASEERKQEYLSSALDQARFLRGPMFSPYLSPTDQLRLDLDELWPHGASAGRALGKLLAVGILRLLTPGRGMKPHVDRRCEPLIDSLCAFRRLAANVYLETPPPNCGGELEFWGQRFTDDELEAWLMPDRTLDREQIGPPSMLLRPSPGDLVLFDTQRIHAVRTVQAGLRVTASCFVGVGSAEYPLSVFA